MTLPPKPGVRPANPHFSSGPCTKHPGWSLSWLDGALLGRYHRSKEAHARLELALLKTRHLLRLPADYRVGIVCPRPTPARWRWRCGRYSGPAASTCSPGKLLARNG
jgi:phosphoserine aminotransferase